MITHNRVGHVTVKVIDTSQGRPASGVALHLKSLADDSVDEAWGETDESGCFQYGGSRHFNGIYRLLVATDRYFASLGIVSLQRSVTIDFRYLNAAEDQELLVLISPYASTVCIVSSPHPEDDCPE